MRIRFNRPRSLETRDCPIGFGLAMRDTDPTPVPAVPGRLGLDQGAALGRGRQLQKLRRFGVGSSACGDRVCASAQANAAANPKKTTVTARLSITASNGISISSCLR
jgi:hypothetical protein